MPGLETLLRLKCARPAPGRAPRADAGPFETALLGDVVAFADQKPDVSVPVFDWHNVEVDGDYFTVARPADNIDVVAHELAVGRTPDRRFELLAGLDRGLPPTGFPSR